MEPLTPPPICSLTCLTMVAGCNEGFWLWFVRKMKNGSVTGSTFSLETSSAPPYMTVSKMSNYAAVTLKMATF